MRSVLVIIAALLALPIASATADDFERGIDRPGNDYRPPIDLEFKKGTLLTFEMECQGLCAKDSKCQAWTMVKPGVQGPKARCYLKNAAPAQRRNNCCVSGVRASSGCLIGGVMRKDIADSDCREAQNTGCIRRLLNDTQYASCIAAQHPKPVKRIGTAKAGGYTNKILEYANSKLGSKVGRGECTDLVSGALAYAGAPAGNFSRSDGHYTWGRRINFPSEAARPGDIIQLVNVKLSFKTANSWGSWETGTQHSAVIVSAEGKLLHVIDQNAPPGSPVGRHDIHLEWTLERGDYAIFRP